MKKSPLALFLLLCSQVFGQGTFGGPGILSRGTGSLGQRSGQDVDLKYFASAVGIYDTGLTPYAVTKDGTLVQPGGLYGVEAGLGAYGRHAFRRSAIGVDYSGNYRHYQNASNFNGANQALGVEYTHQASRRLLFSSQTYAGTQTFGTALGSIAGGQTIVDGSSLLFDNRTNYIQTALNTSYALSQRTAITMGGNFYSVHRQSSALVGVRGYALQGSISHQLSRNTVIGASYQHTHFDFPRAFGESDLNSYSGSWARVLGRRWTMAVSGGIFTSAVQGVQSTALDPAIAALLGITSVNTIYYRENILPMGTATLTRNFRRANLSANYARTVTPGNGVFLTSRQEAYGGSFSYTGVRRVGFSVNGGVTNLTALGQELVPFKQLFGMANFSYNMGAGLNLNLMYSHRYQDVQAATFQRDSSRISIGIFFSPGQIPISFH